MTINQLCTFFEPIPKIYRKLKTLKDVGLGYVALGQSPPPFTEAQQIKLATELSKRDTATHYSFLTNRLQDYTLRTFVCLLKCSIT